MPRSGRAPEDPARVAWILLAASGFVVVTFVMYWRPAATLHFAAEAVACCGVAMVALLLGLALLRVLGIDDGLESIERCVQGFAVGCGALVVSLLALGMAGLLCRGLVLGVLAIAVAIGLARVRGAVGAAAGALAEAAAVFGTPRRAAVGAVIAAGLLLSCVASLMPAVFFDALNYHLELPSLWLESGRLQASQHNFYLNYPANMSLLYLLVRVLDPGASPAMLHWLFLVACGGAVYALGRPLGRRVGLTAAFLFVLTPTALETASYPIADMAVVFWVLASVLAWQRWDEGGGRRWLIVGGAGLGLAVGTKYTAILVGAIPVLACTVLMRGGRTLPSRLKAALLIAVSCVVVFSPWAVRNGVETGDPLYPYLGSPKPEFDTNRSLASEIESRLPEGSGLSRIVAHVFAGPKQIVMEGLGVAPIVGPLLFLGLPLLLVQRPLDRRVTRFLVLAGFGFLLWDLTVQLTRYGLPFVALLAVPSAYGLCRVRRPRQRACVTALAALALVPNLYLAFLTIPWGDVREVMAGRLTRAEYISKYVSYYDVVTWANAELDPASKILFVGEVRGYYTEIPHLTVAPTRPPLIVEMARRGGGKAVGERLLAEGFTHVLLSRPRLQSLMHGRDASFLGLGDAVVEERLATFMRDGIDALYESNGVVIARIRRAGGARGS